MFRLILLALTLGLCLAQDKDATITKFKNEVNGDGTYEYQYETTNGIGVQESGVGGQYATGSIQYYTPEGTLIQLTYVADENGFQPVGEHLPTPPPTPEYVLRALEYIRTHTPQDDPLPSPRRLK